MQHKRCAPQARAYSEAMSNQMPTQHDLTTDTGRPTASQAIDADLERLLEQYASELGREGLTPSAVAAACRVAQRAYMQGWYRGHECGAALMMRVGK